MADHIGDEKDAVFRGLILWVGVVDFHVAEHFQLAFGFAFVLDAFVAA